MSTDLIFARLSSPFIGAIPLDPSSGFGVKYADPSILPSGSPFFGSIDRTPPSLSVHDVLVGVFTGPTVGYPWIPSTGFGVQYAGSFTPTPGGFGTTVNPVGGAAVSSMGKSANTIGPATPIASAAVWTPGVGFGSPYAGAFITPLAFVNNGRGTTFAPSGAAIALGLSNTFSAGNSGALIAFHWTAGSGYGSKYADPATLAIASAVAIRYSPSGATVAQMTNNAGPRWISAYPWTDGGGFGAIYGSAPTGANTSGGGIAFSPNNAFIAIVNGISPFVRVYPWVDGSGFGAKVSDPATLPAADNAHGVEGVAWSDDGLAIVMGGVLSPFMTGYPWSAAGFGAKYTDPALGSGDSTQEIVFALGSATPPSPAQPDGCGPLNLAPKPLTVVAPEPVVRTYPHVDEIGDWATQQSVKLLWDRTHDHESRIRAGVANDQQWVKSANAHGDQIVTLQSAEPQIVILPGQTPPPGDNPPLLTPPPTSPPPTTSPDPDPVPPPSGNPPIDAADMIDLSAATIVNAPDVRGGTWRKTAAMTQVQFAGGQSRFNFSKRDGAGRWPDVTPAGWTGPLQYTVWLFKFIGGTWVGSAFIQFWHDRVGSGSVDDPDVPSRYHQHWYYAARWAPIFGSGAIAPGETIGFMVTSGNERDSVGPYSVQERSNIVTLAATDTGTFNF